MFGQWGWPGYGHHGYYTKVHLKNILLYNLLSYGGKPSNFLDLGGGSSVD
jgi:hypothetical protein